MEKDQVALNIAVLLDRDPVMASRVKQFISEDRLIQVLGVDLDFGLRMLPAPPCVIVEDTWASPPPR